MFNHLHPYGMCRVNDEMFSPPPTFVNIMKMFVGYFYLLHLDWLFSTIYINYNTSWVLNLFTTWI